MKTDKTSHDNETWEPTISYADVAARFPSHAWEVVDKQGNEYRIERVAPTVDDTLVIWIVPLNVLSKDTPTDTVQPKTHAWQPQWHLWKRIQTALLAIEPFLEDADVGLRSEIADLNAVLPSLQNPEDAPDEDEWLSRDELPKDGVRHNDPHTSTPKDK